MKLKLSKTLFKDRENDCLDYEATGQYSEVMYDSEGRYLFRNWRFKPTDTKVIRYPIHWTSYLARPPVYLSCGISKLINLLTQHSFLKKNPF